MIIILFILVSFRDSGGEVNLVFTVENQNMSLCADVFARNNEVIERQEIFDVSVQSSDAAVKFVSNRSSLIIFDDDCKFNIIQ